MAVNFTQSETKDNLMRAFAGESQARNRYTFAAEEARAKGQEAIAQIFLYTANQEKEHAEVFYQFLQEMAGETITIDGGYPVDLTEDLCQLLRMAQHNEYEERNDVYKNFGEKAKEEGFDNIARTFQLIAEIEGTHGDRFGRFAEYMEQNKLHISEVKKGWICLNCGYISDTKEAPEVCPVCQHKQGFFIRLELSPFAVE